MSRHFAERPDWHDDEDEYVPDDGADEGGEYVPETDADRGIPAPCVTPGRQRSPHPVASRPPRAARTAQTTRPVGRVPRWHPHADAASSLVRDLRGVPAVGRVGPQLDDHALVELPQGCCLAHAKLGGDLRDLLVDDRTGRPVHGRHPVVQQRLVQDPGEVGTPAGPTEMISHTPQYRRTDDEESQDSGTKKPQVRKAR